MLKRYCADIQEKRHSVTLGRADMRRPPSQGWRTFLSNHVDGIAAIDLFVLPTIAIKFCIVLSLCATDDDFGCRLA